MKFTEYKGELPKPIVRCKNRETMRSKLLEFYNSNIKIAIVNLDEGEYTNVKNAYLNISRGIKRWGLPLSVHKLGDEIYLVNKEL